MSNIVSGSYTGEESSSSFGLRMVVLSSIILLIAIALLVYSQRGTQESSESPDIFGERKAISQITELSAVESTTGSRSRVGAFGNSGFSSNVNSAVRNTGVQNSTSATDSELSRQITGCAGCCLPRSLSGDTGDQGVSACRPA